MIKIMFVCHGNICRSPMAEFIFKDIVKTNGLDNEFFISSSATSSEEIWNGIGNPIYPPAKAELSKHGIFVKEKRAVLLRKSDYETYDYIVCMDSRNIKNALQILGGDPQNKVYKLLSFVNNNGDVSDPWYSGDFTTCYNDILLGCKGLFDKIAKNIN